MVLFDVDDFQEVKKQFGNSLGTTPLFQNKCLKNNDVLSLFLNPSSLQTVHQDRASPLGVHICRGEVLVLQDLIVCQVGGK